MAKELTLIAYSPGRAPVPSDDRLMLLVDDANPVTIDVSPDPSTWVPEDLTLFCGDRVVATPPVVSGRRWVLTGDERFGTFRAVASAGVTIVESPETVVTAATTAESAGDLLQVAAPGATPAVAGAVDVQAGEYDGRFAAWIALLFACLSAAVLVVISTHILADLDPSTALSAPGNVGPRSGLATAAVLVGVSSILMLAGAALAALEVRSRLRRRADTSVASRGTATTLAKVPAILEQSGRLRGPIALLSTGVIVLAIAVLIQLHWADQYREAPAPPPASASAPE